MTLPRMPQADRPRGVLMTLLHRLKRSWGVATLVLLGAVTVSSLWPAGAPALPGSQLNDKALHALAYAALGLPAALARPRRWRWAPVALIGWSAAIEIAQPSVGRTASLADLAANAGGLALDVAIGALTARLARRT